MVAEPTGGAHADAEGTAEALKPALVRHLDGLIGQDRRALLTARHARFRAYGEFVEGVQDSEAAPAAD